MSIWQKYSFLKQLENNKSQWIFLLSVMVLLMAAVVLTTCFGAVSISPKDLFSLLEKGETDTAAYKIIMHVRLPRVVGAVLAGAALSVSGVIIQSVLSNPLASPNTIGVNAGAGLFVLLISALIPGYAALLPFAAFLGALVTSFLMLLLAAGNSMAPFTLILTGFAISSIWSGGMSAIMILYPDAYVGAGNFLAGGLSGLTMENLRYPSLFAVAGLILALGTGKEMNILSLGLDTAKSLGVNVNKSRVLLITLAALLAGATVSFAGLIGFVGLIVPHGVRLLAGHDHRFLVPASALCGGLFVLVCDFVARVLFAPYELPVGILLCFIGGPFFIYLLYSRKGKIL